jgi:hypothetical protein
MIKVIKSISGKRIFEEVPEIKRNFGAVSSGQMGTT